MPIQKLNDYLRQTVAIELFAHDTNLLPYEKKIMTGNPIFGYLAGIRTAGGHDDDLVGKPAQGLPWLSDKQDLGATILQNRPSGISY